MNKGFTLIELVVTMAIAGTLFLIGFVVVPRGGFAVAQASESLARDFQLARFEAISRNVCSGVVVDSGSESYLLFADSDGDCSYDASADAVYKSVDPGASYGVDIVSASGTPFIFDTRGIPTNASTAPAIHFEMQGKVRYLCVSLAGRPQLQAESC